MPKRLPDLNSPMDLLRDRFLAAMNIVMGQFRIKSLKAFAKAINTPYISLYRIDKYTAIPTSENIYMICTVFKVSPDFIILGKGQMFGHAEVLVRLDALESDMKLVKKLLKLDEEPRKGKRAKI